MQLPVKFHVSIKPRARPGDVALGTTELNAEIIERFRAGRIEIPFPQRAVRILKECCRVNGEW